LSLSALCEAAHRQADERGGVGKKDDRIKALQKHPLNGTTPLMCLKITAFLPLKTPSV
jgi:hypothetical protein